mmetsp:Transcript_12797/g.19836  ORF Transcript_12797/g.19836 Transcript_12797/m.19836 type:complete len:202 (+) Transcript_12797:473-1078(+)
MSIGRIQGDDYRKVGLGQITSRSIEGRSRKYNRSTRRFSIETVSVREGYCQVSRRIQGANASTPSDDGVQGPSRGRFVDSSVRRETIENTRGGEERGTHRIRLYRYCLQGEGRTAGIADPRIRQSHRNAPEGKVGCGGKTGRRPTIDCRKIGDHQASNGRIKEHAVPEDYVAHRVGIEKYQSDPPNIIFGRSIEDSGGNGK